jgi:hypothetical protein
LNIPACNYILPFSGAGVVPSVPFIPQTRMQHRSARYFTRVVMPGDVFPIGMLLTGGLPRVWLFAIFVPLHIYPEGPGRAWFLTAQTKYQRFVPMPAYRSTYQQSGAPSDPLCPDKGKSKRRALHTGPVTISSVRQTHAHIDCSWVPEHVSL